MSCAATSADDNDKEPVIDGPVATTKAALTTFGPFTISGQSSISLGRSTSTDACWISGIGGNLTGTLTNSVQLDASTGTWLIAHNLISTTGTVSAMCTSWASIGATSANGNFFVQTATFA